MKLAFKNSLLIVVALSLAAAARAQVADKKSLTLDGAKRIIAVATAEARRDKAPGAVIAVVDDGGNLIALERLDGTFSAGANISIGKARTAVMFKKPTKFFEDVIKNGRTAMVALPDFTPLQGGVPIILDGQLVGGVGVSGASTAQQDEELAIAGANAIQNPEAALPPVTYFPKETVDAAFAKGSVLFNNNQSYMVHASRRDGPGMAEVHVKDADIIHVLEGSATFVTGGTVVEPKTIAPDEIRGKEIAGGETRRLEKGDVIIVPALTPHWFKEISGSFVYFVVKDR